MFRMCSSLPALDSDTVSATKLLTAVKRLLVGVGIGHVDDVKAACSNRHMQLQR